jgi:hypothetical protein
MLARQNASLFNGENAVLAKYETPGASGVVPILYEKCLRSRRFKSNPEAPDFSIPDENILVLQGLHAI